MKRYQPISFTGNSPWIGKTIAGIEWGDPTREKTRAYSAITLHMTDGTTFVITQSMGEPTIGQAVD